MDTEYAGEIFVYIVVRIIILCFVTPDMKMRHTLVNQYKTIANGMYINKYIHVCHLIYICTYES